jgi:uncharacterized tellurite resistance protein B-like protein
MFDFFNKKSSPKHNFSGFSNQFTKDQKAAILSSLMILAKADGNVNNKETKQIESMFQMLDIEMDDPAFRKFYTAGGKEEIERILNTLSESNKEWFVMALHEMMTIDGPANDEELMVVSVICHPIGITIQKYAAILKKVQNMRGSLGI